MDLTPNEAREYLKKIEQSLADLNESEKLAAQTRRKQELERRSEKRLEWRSQKRVKVKGLGLVITNRNNMASSFEEICPHLRKDGISEDVIAELKKYFKTRGVIKNWSIRTGDQYDPYAAFVHLPDHLAKVLKGSFAKGPYFNDPAEWS